MDATHDVVVVLLNGRIEHELDAIAAYESAIERLDRASDRDELGAFLRDHRRHVVELGDAVQALGAQAAQHANMRRVVTQGRVVLGGLVSERAILMAMKRNEEETNEAYEAATSRADVPNELRMLLERALEDERRHLAWIERRLSGLVGPLELLVTEGGGGELA